MSGAARLDPAQPFYFGPAAQQLFACHHAPGAGRRGFGIVVCPPFGQEHVRSHRALRLLAELLAADGFDVLRFDYYGTGDSAGRSEEGDVRQWREDAARAVATLRARAAVPRFGMVGLRLGAAIAALVGAELGGLDALVLWQPVTRGRDYLDDLLARHRGGLARFPAPIARGEGRGSEALGFPLPARLARSVDAVDLLSLGSSPARSCLVLEGRADVDPGPLSQLLAGLGTEVEVGREDGQEGWVDDRTRVLVPHRALTDIAAWLARTAGPR